jgi:hypothetical protein
MTNDSKSPPGSPEPPAGPVFIVGMNGSGTTMLADSLGKHPGLYVFPHEVRLLPYLIMKAQESGACATLAQRRAVADELGSAKPIWHANRWQDLRVSDETLARAGIAETIDAVFTELAGRVGKARWGEKSPMNILHIELLARTFPQARFLHIIRDGRDAAQSFHRRYGFVPQETIYRWRRVVAKGRESGARLGSARYFELTYEGLTSDPDRWMLRVCEFLGLPFDPVVLSSSMRMVDPGRVNGEQRIIANSGHWSTYFSPAQQRDLEAISGRYLRELGYSVSTDGQDDPFRWRLAWWRTVGVVRRTILHFERWGIAGVPAYLRTLATSAKQAATGRE